MNKKFFSAMLFGLFTLGIATTFVSCKDYDDDISTLNTDVTSLQTAQATLENEISSLKSQLETATSAVSQNTSLVSTLEARLETAEAALESVKTLAAGKVDQSTYDSKVAEIEGQLAALGLADKNEATTREDADKAIQLQIDALKKFQEAQEAANAAQKTTDATQDESIKDLIAKLEKLQKTVEGNDADIDAINEELKTIKNNIESIQADLSTLNLLFGSELRSLVFVPDFYYYGVEATELKTMNYKYYTLKDVDADTDGETNLTTTTGEKVTCDPSTDATHLRYKTTAAFNVLNFAATYHMNPSSALLDDAKYNLLSEDAKYTRAAAAGLKIVGTPAKNAIGDLVVNLGVTNPSAVKKVTECGTPDSYITVFATEVTLPVADKAKAAKGETYTVTSDYAAVKATSVDGGYVLSNVCKEAGHETLDATDAERITMTGVYNANACGACAYKTAAGRHLFNTFEEAAYPQGKRVQPTTDAQACVAWDGTLDLRRLVETHYVATDEPVKVADMNANNLTYKFEIVGSFYGTNTTSEGAHALIESDGYTLHPQMPTAAGKQNKEVGTQDKATVNRQPVIRVSLVDTEKNQVLDYGYIRVRIVENVIVDPGKSDKYISYTGDEWKYTINHGCKDNDYAPYKWSNNWIQVEYDLYSMLGISKVTFDSYYTAETSSDYAGLAQYKKVETKNNDGSTVTTFEYQKTAVGTFDESINTGASETTTLNWTVSAAEMKALYNKVGTYEIARAIKYVSNDKTNYPDVYVLVTSGKIVVVDGGTASGKFTGLDNNKIAEYWYKHNSNKVQGKDEARINVPTLEDGKATIAEPFETVLASQFNGNEIDAASMITVTDPTSDKAFDKAKLSYDLEFDQSNVGKEFKGQTGTTYVLSISDDGKSLYANVKGQTTKEVIATLEIADASKPASVNNTKLAYQHGTFAEDLVNCQKYDEMTDDMLTVVIGIYVKNECGMTLAVTDNTFNERFVRPINVTDNGKEIEDAKDAQQVINLKDLVSFTDWRGYAFADHLAYWQFYNIKSITVRGASAGSSINSKITTNMNGGTLGQTKLSSVSDLVEFTYNPITPATPGAAQDYGTIVYTNNSNNVQTFTVKIPVRVNYEWGYIDTDVTVKVLETHGAKRK